MGKQKTYKALAKRVKLTKTGKVLKRRAGQDHFNTRATGKITRKKRRDQVVPTGIMRAVKVLTPHK